jgi:hypothetical protein
MDPELEYQAALTVYNAAGGPSPADLVKFRVLTLQRLCESHRLPVTSDGRRYKKDDFIEAIRFAVSVTNH